MSHPPLKLDFSDTYTHTPHLPFPQASMIPSTSSHTICKLLSSPCWPSSPAAFSLLDTKLPPDPPPTIVILLLNTLRLHSSSWVCTQGKGDTSLQGRLRITLPGTTLLCSGAHGCDVQLSCRFPAASSILASNEMTTYTHYRRLLVCRF